MVKDPSHEANVTYYPPLGKQKYCSKAGPCDGNFLKSGDAADTDEIEGDPLAQEIKIIQFSAKTLPLNKI